MTSNSPFARFENFARDLVEGSFDRLLGHPGSLSMIVNGLAEAASNSERYGTTANQYTVNVHPDTLSDLIRQIPDLATNLEVMLARKGELEGLLYAGKVRVDLIADPEQKAGESTISAHRSLIEDEPTAVLHRRKGSTASLRMLDAYLIVDGRRHVVIDKAVTSIGRSLDNDVVLEDPGVSRTHAQIRWRSGRFVIFDLGSRSGTLVNAQRHAECELKSGDVLTLGSAALIYGEEDGADDRSNKASRPVADVTQELSADD